MRPFIRFTRDVTLTMSFFGTESEEGVEWFRRFKAGDLYHIGEFSPVPDEAVTVIEFYGLGYAEVPDDAWIYDEGTRLWVSIDGSPGVN